MSNSELQTYFRKRLNDLQSESVPDFDVLFEGENLLPTKAPVRLWPISAVVLSAVAAVALLFILVLNPESSQKDSMLAKETQETSSEWPVSGSPAEPATLETSILAESSPELLASETTSQRAETTTASESPADPAVSETLIFAESSPELLASETTSQPTETTTTSESSSEMEQAVQSTVPETTIYQRSIEEAYALAAEKAKEKKKHPKRKPTIGAQFQYGNDMLASLSQHSAQSDISSAIQEYHHPMLRSGERRKNVWLNPKNVPLEDISEFRPKYNFPMTAGLSISIPLYERLDLQTGLNYSFLSSNVSGTTKEDARFSLYQELHYIGIPVRCSYRIIDSRAGLYVSAGGALEKGLSARQESRIVFKSGQADLWQSSQKVEGIQPSVELRLGASYQIAKKLQGYVEPGLVYYFDTEQFSSIRSKHPLYVNLGFGICFRTN